MYRCSAINFYQDSDASPRSAEFRMVSLSGGQWTRKWRTKRFIDIESRELPGRASGRAGSELAERQTGRDPRSRPHPQAISRNKAHYTELPSADNCSKRCENFDNLFDGVGS